MYFHEIAEELKTYIAPSEHCGIFVVQLVGDTLHAPVTDEKEKMALDDKFNSLASGMSLNMQDKNYEGKNIYQRIELDLSASDMMEQILLRKLIISLMQIKNIYKHS